MDIESHISPMNDSVVSCRFSPYRKRLARKHPHAICAQSRGPCNDRSDERPSPETMQFFVRGIQALPNDILRSVVIEKFASAERSRHQLFLATWDLEATKRRVLTLEQIQRHFESAHVFTESEFKFWLKMYTDRGLPDLKEDELFYGSQISPAAREADRDATELSVMVECARERGLDVDSLDGGHEANNDEEHTTLGEDL